MIFLNFPGFVLTTIVVFMITMTTEAAVTSFVPERPASVTLDGCSLFHIWNHAVRRQRTTAQANESREWYRTMIVVITFAQMIIILVVLLIMIIIIITLILKITTIIIIVVVVLIMTSSTCRKFHGAKERKIEVLLLRVPFT